MRSTKTRSTSLLALAVVCSLSGMAGAAHAQQVPPPSSSKAQKLEWPRTFTGQPDFAFTRDEAVGEARIRAAREAEPMPLTPSLQQLITDDVAIDPMRVSTTSATTINLDDPSATTADISGTAAPQGQTLMERLMAQAVDLPTISETAPPDLSEFTARLNTTITQTVANWQPQAGSYNFEGAASKLVLQAIVTSPLKYAVINQQKYAEGETFRLSVPMPVPDDVITRALQAQMPVSGTLPANLQASYDDALKNTLGAFMAKRNASPEIGRQVLVLPVRITAITPRQVLLDLNGQPYNLNIRYAY